MQAPVRQETSLGRQIPRMEGSHLINAVFHIYGWCIERFCTYGDERLHKNYDIYERYQS
jgi:hypothetical protein